MNLTRSPLVLIALSATLWLAGCERPPTQTVQRGYRGTGMDQVYNPRTLAKAAPANKAPEPLAAVPPGGPPAATVFKNVQVLNDLGVGEFTRLMVAMTQWVAPEQGCAYCHAPGADFSDDSLYTKVVARKMLQMTRHINTDWKTHVAGTGVTCYTCHRGQNIPAQVWFTAPDQKQAQRLAGNKAGQNTPAASVALAALPYDPFTPFLSQGNEIRVVGNTPLAGANRQSIKQTEWTYSLMMHMSDSLGVNCTYCHNSRSFSSWDTSTPQRATAWYGIRMARDVNTNYMESLTKVFPAHRLGPDGDVAKVNCGTCHQGAFKPLYGAAMLKDYPQLGAVAAPPPSAPAPAPATPVADAAATPAAAKP
jgi:photosynthetic reaction center cytochrome c subunit